jgi:hypothetical protein
MTETSYRTSVSALGCDKIQVGTPCRTLTVRLLNRPRTRALGTAKRPLRAALKTELLQGIGIVIIILANLPRRLADPFGRYRWTAATAVGTILEIAGFVLGGGKLGHTGGVLQTGGFCSGFTSTRSSPCLRARAKAFVVGISPRAVPSKPMTDTIWAAMSPFPRTLCPRAISLWPIIAQGLATRSPRACGTGLVPEVGRTRKR